MAISSECFERLIVGLFKNLSARSKGFEITTAIKQPTSRALVWGTEWHEKNTVPCNKSCAVIRSLQSFQNDLNLYWNSLKLHSQDQTVKGWARYREATRWAWMQIHLHDKPIRSPWRIWSRKLQLRACAFWWNHDQGPWKVFLGVLSCPEICPRNRRLTAKFSARGKCAASLTFSQCKPWK